MPLFSRSNKTGLGASGVGQRPKRIKADKPAKMPKARKGAGNLVLKLAPDHWLLADVLIEKDGQPYLRRLASYPLPRQIDPNRPNLELELLQESLTTLVEQEGFVGHDVSVVLPSSGSITHSHLVPFDLTKKSDLKEFRLGADEKEFWQEFEPEVQDAKLPVFRYQYLAAGDEPRSSQVYFSWADQFVLNKYIDLCLSARLYPVALIPETEAILNLLVPRVDRLEREGYFGLLHLARGRSHLLAVGAERIVSAKVNIDELDEELLDEIESLDDISGDFWAEVGARMASALRQAVMYLREQEKTPNFRNIYVICEMPKCDNTLELIRQHFNLGNLKNWQPLSGISMDIARSAPAIQAIPNQAAWASLVGGGLLGLREPKMVIPTGEVPRFQLNLHPQHRQLHLNRQLRRVSKFANWGSFVLGAAFLSWILIDFGPQYLRLDQQVRAGLPVIQERDAQQATLQGLDSSTSSINAQLTALEKAAVENSRSKFLVALPSALPDGTELSRLEIDESKVVMNGHAFEPTGPQQFLNQLIVQKILISPTLEVSQPATGADQMLTFKITGTAGMVN